MHYTIATHDGPFHGDEVLACAMLQEAYADVSTEIIRTNDPEGADIWVDVGGTYHHAEQKFDHHQVDDPKDLARSDGAPLASAGLVWRHYGGDICAYYDGPTDVLWSYVDENLVRGVDAYDVGMAQDSSRLIFSEFISSLNPHDEDHRGRFTKAVSIAKWALRGQLLSAEAIATGKEKVLNAPAVDIGEGYSAVEFEQYHPFNDTIEYRDEDKEAFVFFPQEGVWKAMQIPKSAEKPEYFQPKYFGFPDDLPDAEFVHPSGFMAVADTREDIISVMREAVKQKS